MLFGWTCYTERRYQSSKRCVSGLTFETLLCYDGSLQPLAVSHTATPTFTLHDPHTYTDTQPDTPGGPSPDVSPDVTAGHFLFLGLHSTIKSSFAHILLSRILPLRGDGRLDVEWTVSTMNASIGDTR